MELRRLPLEERAYVMPDLAPLEVGGAMDAAGLPLFVRDGTSYRHPVMLAQRALALLDGHRQTRDPRYLAAARTVADVLAELSVDLPDGRYLPYPFAFDLHGRPAERLEAPWYSGMAQGQAASVFCRLHDFGGRPADLDLAAGFVAALRPHGRRGPWISEVDEAGYLWIEEYPGPRPDRTLNGYAFALFGLYDFIMATADPQARRLLLGGLSCLRHYLPDFRVPGGLSVYCLAHRVQNAKYHAIHVEQLGILAAMTGQADLARYAELLGADA
ncbi:MAG TPA: D-glucuronyl C5-epimerase family protein [Candidatus Limnocylindrales bacterium]|nr:D-glucuronyl C5-epimerase family protein [Candidatus Limnocylindrales bacterium]